MRIGRHWLLSLLAALACGAPPPAKPAAPATAPAPPAGHAWLTTLDRDHPLVGKLWDVRAGAFVTPEQLTARLRGARFVMLGERHDHPDHHVLQARALQALVQAGRRPALVLEMLEVEQQADVTAYAARPGASAAGFGAALGWDKSSWPPYAQYQAIFDVAFAAKLPIWAGNLARADAKALVKQGLSVLGDERVKELRLDGAFPPALEAGLLQELRDSHCGHLPEGLLAPMALAQHARDAQMARVLLQTGADGACLVAGAGHGRKDRGVPYYLGLQAPDASVLSLSIQEVAHDARAPREYATEPFDYLWFTPRLSDEDPCAAFKGG